MALNDKNEIVSIIKDSFLNKFNNSRIVSLLFFGTRAFNINRDNSDYDFIIILDKYDKSDLSKIRSLCDINELKSIDLNLNLIYHEDIKTRKKENFQIRSLALGFYEYLSVAKVIYGKNIFYDDPLTLSPQDITNEYKFKLQEYYGRCDKLFVQKKSDKNLYDHLAKYTLDIIRFFIILKGIIKIKDMAKYSFEDILEVATNNKVFNQNLLNRLPSLLKPYVDKECILEIENIRRLVYEDYLSLFF